MVQLSCCVVELGSQVGGDVQDATTGIAAHDQV